MFMDSACACDDLFPLPVKGKAVLWTWCAFAMAFPPCLSRKRPFHGLGSRLRLPFPPACRGKGRLVDLVCACDGLFPSASAPAVADVTPRSGQNVRTSVFVDRDSRGQGQRKTRSGRNLRPPEVGPNCPLYKFKGSHQRDTRTTSCAQDIGSVKERYPDVAQILGLVKAFPPHPSARCHKARLRRRRPHCSIVQTCMPTNESGIEQNTKSTKLVWTFIRWRQAEEMNK